MIRKSDILCLEFENCLGTKYCGGEEQSHVSYCHYPIDHVYPCQQRRKVTIQYG